jgi:hypothetical protein
MAQDPLTLLLGSMVSLLGIYYVQHKTRERDIETRAREAAERRVQLWKEFELKTLVELHGCLVKLLWIPREISVKKKYAEIKGHTEESLRENNEFIAKIAVFCSEADALALRLINKQLYSLVRKYSSEALRLSLLPADDLTKELQSFRGKFESISEIISEIISNLKPHPYQEKPISSFWLKVEEVKNHISSQEMR